MRPNYIMFLVVFLIPALVQPVFCAQKAPIPFSTYGEIQPVQKYSSNPYWTKDSPYNQRIMPTPIYATGADLNTGDCNRVVNNLVASYCASNNNCADKRIADARPTIMVQLSQLPGHNFATSCAGFIDNIFENYKKTYGNSSAGTVAIAYNTNSTQAIQLKNPFAPTLSAYETGVQQRTNELKQLQAENSIAPSVEATDFPKTIDDVSFTDRMANSTTGYEPYKDKKSYIIPQFESDEDYLNRLKIVNPQKYCAEHPQDQTVCGKTTTGGGGSSTNNNSDDDNNDDDDDVPCDNPGSSADCPIILNLN